VLHGARAEMPVKLWMRGGPLHDEGYPRRANVGGKGGGGERVQRSRRWRYPDGRTSGEAEICDYDVRVQG